MNFSSFPSQVLELTHRQRLELHFKAQRPQQIQRKAWRQVSHAKQEIKNQVKNQGNPSCSYFTTFPGLHSAELNSTPSYATTSPCSHLPLQGLKTSPKAQAWELSFIFCKKHAAVSGIPGEQTWRMRHPRRLSQVKITLWFFLWHFPSQGYPNQTPSSSWKLA